jgi:putative ABC transport system ATP-binding protein
VPSRRQIDAGYGVDMLPACRADALSKVYGRRDTAVHALREITLSIPSQAFTAIMGPSGSGKSTLLHCLAALDTPTSGRVFLGQTELTSLSRRQQAQVRRDRIGFVFQSFNLVPTLDAIENITLPQLLAGRRPDKEWLEYVVARIGLGDRLHHRPSQLSGGQQQRVALARALAGRPEVIFADEPTGNLDTKASREMLALLRSAVDDFRQTVVTVTHDPAIAGYADQVLFFTDGQVVDQVLQPETNLVLEHLQYLDSSAPAHVGPRGQLHASTQSDGQHTMRSRRRRRADETGPGRPMVGSDDEVEVARQERWLQRIREQFEAEHEVLDTTDTHAGTGVPGSAHLSNGNGVHSGMSNGVPPAQPSRNGHDHGRYGYETDTGMQPEDRNGHHIDGHHPGAGHPDDDVAVVDAVVDHDTGWLPAERSWLTGSPDDTSGQFTGTQDTWSETASTAYSGPSAQGPVSEVEQWHTSDWQADPQAPRWDASPIDTGQPGTWNPDDDRTGTWHPDDDRTGTWHPPANGMADSARDRDEHWRSGEDPPTDVWSDADPAADEAWAEIMPSQPPARTWGAPAPEQHHNRWREPTPEARPATWQPWQRASEYEAEPVDDARHSGYDNARHNGYDEPAAPTDVPDPADNGAYGVPGEPAQRNGSAVGWSVGAPATGYGGRDDQHRWDDVAEVVAEPEPSEPGPDVEPLDIWSPAAAQDEVWAPSTSDDSWTPAQRPPTQAFGADANQTGPFDTIEPAPPDADRYAAWEAAKSFQPVEDDPNRTPPRPDRRSTDTATDPFEALQSLQSQLNRLGGNGRRPPRRHEE